MDVTTNTTLEYLHCEENQLVSLNLRNNPLLKIVSLRDNSGDWWKALGKGKNKLDMSLIIKSIKLYSDVNFQK
jgi:hypothetical protein